jgi:uncharacterized surface protein with fasciclin (FAS1) repeats
MNGRTFFGSIIATAALALGLAAPLTAEASPPKATNNIVDVAIAVNSSGAFAGQFDTLIAAVLAADPAVIKRLTAKRQSTVFAPTDDAFAKLGYDATSIVKLPKEFLTDVLVYHVLNGRRGSADILASTRLRTLQGGILRQAGGVLTDNLGRQAAIIVTDVPASNGVIHAIDTVVLPYAP